MNKEEVFVVIPAFNEGPALGSVVSAVRKYGYEVIVVDDCSKDSTSQVAYSEGARVCRHPINLGQGAALQTGIDLALKLKAKYIVTFDADGQHPAEAIQRALKVFESDPEIEVILGSRFLKKDHATQVPFLRKCILKLALVFTRLTAQIPVTDTHNGFRVFSAEALKKFRINQNRMAHASEILNKISQKKIKFQEIPIEIVYTAYSRAKGQRMSNAVNVLWELFSSFLGGLK